MTPAKYATMRSLTAPLGAARGGDDVGSSSHAQPRPPAAPYMGRRSPSTRAMAHPLLAAGMAALGASNSSAATSPSRPPLAAVAGAAGQSSGYRSSLSDPSRLRFQSASTSPVLQHSAATLLGRRPRMPWHTADAAESAMHRAAAAIAAARAPRQEAFTTPATLRGHVDVTKSSTPQPAGSAALLRQQQQQQQQNHRTPTTSPLAPLLQRVTMPVQPSPPRRMDAIDHPAVQAHERRRVSLSGQRQRGSPRQRPSVHRRASSGNAAPPRRSQAGASGGAMHDSDTGAGGGAGTGAGGNTAAQPWPRPNLVRVEYYGDTKQQQQQQRSPGRGRTRRRGQGRSRRRRDQSTSPSSSSQDTSSSGSASSSASSSSTSRPSSSSASSSSSSRGRGRGHRTGSRKRSRGRRIHSKSKRKRKKKKAHKRRKKRRRAQVRQGRSSRSRSKGRRGHSKSRSRSKSGKKTKKHKRRHHGGGGGGGGGSSSSSDEAGAAAVAPFGAVRGAQWSEAAPGTRAARVVDLMTQLPRRRRKQVAAAYIQAVIRGWAVRRTVGVALATRRQQIQRVSISIIQSLVDECVVDDLLPQVLMEVFTDRLDAINEPNPAEKAMLAARADIVSEVVTSLTQTAVRGVVRGLINNVLLSTRAAAQRNVHPLLLLVDDVVAATLPALLLEAARQSVNDLVAEFLVGRHFDEWFTQTLHPMVRGVAVEAYLEEDTKSSGAVVIDEVVAELAKDAATAAARDARRQRDEERRGLQGFYINAAARRILKVAALRMALGSMATRADHAARRYMCKRMLRGMMLRHLTGRAAQLQQGPAAALATCVPLRAGHAAVTTHMTTALLVALLQRALMAEERGVATREALADAAKKGVRRRRRGTAMRKSVARIKLAMRAASVQRGSRPGSRSNNNVATVVRAPGGERLDVHSILGLQPSSSPVARRPGQRGGRARSASVVRADARMADWSAFRSQLGLQADSGSPSPGARLGSTQPLPSTHQLMASPMPRAKSSTRMEFALPRRLSVSPVAAGHLR